MVENFGHRAGLLQNLPGHVQPLTRTTHIYWPYVTCDGARDTSVSNCLFLVIRAVMSVCIPLPIPEFQCTLGSPSFLETSDHLTPSTPCQ